MLLCNNKVHHIYLLVLFIYFVFDDLAYIYYFVFKESIFEGINYQCILDLKSHKNNDKLINNICGYYFL